MGGYFASTGAVYNVGEATIYGGEFVALGCSGCRTPYAYALNNRDENNVSGTMEVIPANDDDVKVHGTQGALAAAGGAKVHVTGGAFYTEPCANNHAGSTFYALYVSGKANMAATCVVDGGRFSTTGSNACVYLVNEDPNDNGGEPGKAEVKINGGTFDQGSAQRLINFDNKPGGKLEVLGGNFIGKDIDSVKSYLVEGLKLQENGNGGYSVVSNHAAAIGNERYATLAKAIGAVENGQTITVLQDVADSARVQVNKAVSFSFDLNGHTISGGDQFALLMINDKEASVKVFNGKLESLKTDFSARGVIYIQQGNVEVSNIEINGAARGIGVGPGVKGYSGSLTVGDGARISGVESGIGVFGGLSEAEPCSIAVNEGALITGDIYGIAGNGDNDNTTITVNGGSIAATGKNPASGGLAAGIYHPQQGELVVNGGSISGIVGIQIGAGNAVIRGGEISSTDTERIETPYKPSSQGDGMVRDGSALSLVSRSAYGDLSVSVAGGTFRTANSGNQAVMKYGFAYQDNDWLVIPEPTKSSLNISGGAFSNDVSNHCPDGYGIAKTQANPLYTVHKHSVETVVTKKATCIAQGEQTTGCAIEGCTGHKTVESIAVDPDAHSWGAWTVVRNAAAGIEGLEQRVCAHHSSHVETRAIAALPVQKPSNSGSGSNDNQGSGSGGNQGNGSSSNNGNGSSGGSQPTLTPNPQGNAADDSGASTGATLADGSVPPADSDADTQDEADAAAESRSSEETIAPDTTPLTSPESGATDNVVTDQGAYNRLPWIVAAAIAALGLLFFVILKRRKNDEERDGQRI